MELNKLSLIKILELAIAITCICLHCKVITHDFDTDTLCAIAYGGYIIILVGAIAGLLLDTPIDKKIYVYFCVVGCVTFIISGVLTLDIVLDWHLKTKLKDYALAKSILAIIDGILFIVDAVLEWRES